MYEVPMEFQNVFHHAAVGWHCRQHSVAFTRFRDGARSAN
jgi:hypothetical protein